jgi:hypothetical protein
VGVCGREVDVAVVDMVAEVMDLAEIGVLASVVKLAWGAFATVFGVAGRGEVVGLPARRLETWTSSEAIPGDGVAWILVGVAVRVASGVERFSSFERRRRTGDGVAVGFSAVGVAPGVGSPKSLER